MAECSLGTHAQGPGFESSAWRRTTEIPARWGGGGGGGGKRKVIPRDASSSRPAERRLGEEGEERGGNATERDWGWFRS